MIVQKLGKYIVLPILLLAVAVFAGACSKGAEPVDTQLGIDGYVYLPEKLLSASGVGEIKRYGDFLYCRVDGDVRKIALESMEDAAALESELGLENLGETVLTVPQSVFEQKTASYPDNAPYPIYDTMRKQILGLGKEFYRFWMKDYAVDSEENLYYYMEASVGEKEEEGDFYTIDMESIGGVLYKQTPEGETVYELALPSAKKLAVSPDSNLCVLCEEGILIINQEGQKAGKIDLAEYRGGSDENVIEYFVEDAWGHLYYIIVHGDLTQTVAEITATIPPRMEEISGLLKEGGNDIFPAQNGNLLISDYNKGVVSLYDRESASANLLLRWEDVDQKAEQFRQLLVLSPDRILAIGAFGSETVFYRLTRTPVSELPKKELVVLASLSPDLALRQAVVDFNQASSRYHVIIETYGDSYAEGSARLDATLVSSTPPDILDLQDVYKYCSQGIPEDLNPYLENSDIVSREDFLDNVVEGYTIDGRLVCIPTSFSIFLAAGRASQLDPMAFSNGWTMKDVYALTDRYPGSLLLHSGYDLGPEERDRILDRFCSMYYLEEFIDWETGTCSFDSEEFRRMILWLDGHSGQQVFLPLGPSGYTVVEKVLIPEDALLTMKGFSNFEENLEELESQFQEEIRLLGVPTVDGRNRGLIFTHDALCIVSDARNKEGAWAFLEYYLSLDPRFGRAPYLPSRKSLLGEMLKNVDAQQKQLAESLFTAIETSDFSPLPDSAEMIKSMVTEELGSYYSGDKSLEEATRILQNRVQLLLQESIQ